MTIEVFIKKPEKVEVLKYDGTNSGEVVKFVDIQMHKLKRMVPGDYIIKVDNNILVQHGKPNFAQQELIGSYIKDVVQGVTPNARMSLEKLQECFETPIVDDRFLKKDVNKKSYKNICKCEQQDSNHTSKPSNFSLRNLVMQIAPKHIKYYIKRLEEYGFKIFSISEAWFSAEEAYLPFISLEDEIGNHVVITDRDRARDICGDYAAFTFHPYTSRCEQAEFEVENNNWREAFNKLVASFPDEIMKNTNHHASLSS